MTAVARQAGKFGLVGILNTIIDFGIFNFAHSVFGLNPLVANIISTTVAMIVSFTINRQYVFGGGDRSAAMQALLFLLVTAFGLYGLQTGVIYLVTTVVFHSNGVLASNMAKIIASAVSLVWNFAWYRRVVFI